MAHLAVDELDITRTLRVAVSRTILRTSLVVRESGHAAVSSHLREVHSAVQTARQLRDVHVERELHAVRLEQLVGRIRVHEVRTRANVLLCGLGHELEGERVAVSSDTVSAYIPA